MLCYIWAMQLSDVLRCCLDSRTTCRRSWDVVFVYHEESVLAQSTQRLKAVGNLYVDRRVITVCNGENVVMFREPASQQRRRKQSFVGVELIASLTGTSSSVSYVTSARCNSLPTSSVPRDAVNHQHSATSRLLLCNTAACT